MTTTPTASSPRCAARSRRWASPGKSIPTHWPPPPPRSKAQMRVALAALRQCAVHHRRRARGHRARRPAPRWTTTRSSRCWRHCWSACRNTWPCSSARVSKCRWRWRAGARTASWWSSGRRICASIPAMRRRWPAASCQPVPMPALVQAALERSDGWAVGLSMLLQPAHAGGGTRHTRRSQAATTPCCSTTSPRKCSASCRRNCASSCCPARCLDEFNPALCAAVSGAPGCRRHCCASCIAATCSSTPIDEMVPVLRFHDLFRDFLQSTARRRYSRRRDRGTACARGPGRNRAGAGGGASASRRGHWREALALITKTGEELLAEGAIGAVERWFQQIPEAVRAHDAHVAYLNGSCGWLRWDWARAGATCRTAIAGLTQPRGTAAPRARAVPAGGRAELRGRHGRRPGQPG